MTDLDRAIAAAREALHEHDAYGMPIDAGTIRDLLAALDAQVPVAWQWRRKGQPWVHEYTFLSPTYATTDDSEVRELFAAPPAALAVPPERDWTMIQSGDASIPAWVAHYANVIGAYMKVQNVQHWAVGPVQSRNEAQQPAAAVPDDAIEAAYWDFDARHKGYGPHKITPQSERDAFKWAVRAMLAAERNKEGG